jgi:hypothetical protein
MAIFSAFLLLFRSLFVSRLSLATEILVLRQQILVLNRTVKRPKIRQRDRLFWVCLSKLWKDWRDALIIVKPDTVIKWHRQGYYGASEGIKLYLDLAGPTNLTSPRFALISEAPILQVRPSFIRRPHGFLFSHRFTDQGGEGSLKEAARARGGRQHRIGRHLHIHTELQGEIFGQTVKPRQPTAQCDSRIKQIYGSLS